MGKDIILNDEGIGGNSHLGPWVQQQTYINKLIMHAKHVLCAGQTFDSRWCHLLADCYCVPYIHYKIKGSCYEVCA
jgi:hypothetical protein